MFLGLGCIAAGTIAWIVIRSITRQLGANPSEIQERSETIAQGSLEMELDSTNTLAVYASMVKSILENLGGTIRIGSKVSKGTCVDIKIPIQIGGVLLKQKPIKLEATNTLNVLIVEDNPVNQMTLKALVKKLGYLPHTSDNGLEAVERCKETKFDCILMDCQMPIMDGFQATREIRRINGPNQRAPIVAVTANAMNSDKQQCIDVGMNDHMKKPINKNALKEKLEFWIFSIQANIEPVD